MSASKQLLEQLHEVVGMQLLERIQSGNANASDFAQAIKFLKDNGIEALPTDTNPLGALAKSLQGRVPFSDPSDPTIN